MTTIAGPCNFAPPIGADETNPFRKGQDAETAQSTRATDQQLVDHLCAPGCGCGRGDDSVTVVDPLKILEDRDQEVRQHEQEHLREAGDLASGGPVFDTVMASNGHSYAVGGHVNVNVSEVKGDPKKTIERMQQIQRAALAPAQPSGQDRKVAADAAFKEQQANQQLLDPKASKAGGGHIGGWNLAGSSL